MYPKTNGKATGPNKQATRDQLNELLINKFRNKYSVSVQNEQGLDACIQKEVSRIVRQEAPVGERELNEVDRIIATAVMAARGEAPTASKQAAQPKDDDVRSSVSKA
jgi:hypothetical protein